MGSPLRSRNHVQEYIYDFAVDGGSTGAVDLSAKAGSDPLPQGCIVTKVGLKVITAVVGTSSTVAVGNTTDADGFMAAIAEATLVDEYVSATGVQAGALLWDDTNDHDIPFLVNSANDADFSITIGTADLTAGKLVLWVEYYMPSED
jgi:hypothetical protein